MTGIIVCAANENSFVGPQGPDCPGYIHIQEKLITACIYGQCYQRNINLASGWRWKEECFLAKLLLFSQVFSSISELFKGGECLDFYLHNSRDIKLYLFVSHLLDVKFGVTFVSAPARVAVEDYAFYTQAKFMHFPCQVSEQDFNKKYICPLPGNDTAKDVKALLPKSIDKKKLLLVGYFAGPCRTVGVLRINYWFETIAELSNQGWEVELATAIDWPDRPGNVHYVADKHFTSLLPVASDLEPRPPRWKLLFRRVEEDYAKSVSTLGFFWRYGLERYFDERPECVYDAVVITGNPFSYFDFAAYAKAKWSSKVLLDYRDPFANNPRFKYTDEARQKAQFIEQGYNFQADCLLTVNDDCIPYTVNSGDIPIKVVANGFDDRTSAGIPVPLRESEGVHFVHAGAIYYDRSPTALLENLESGKHFFHHVGKLDGINAALIESDTFISHGQCTYEDTLEKIGAGHCGVVFVSEAGFETPTKLYDYIAMGLDILVCTIGPVNHGALSVVLKQWPRVFWCKNSPEGVKQFLDDYQPLANKCEGNSMLYSRKDSTQELIGLLDELVSE